MFKVFEYELKRDARSTLIRLSKSAPIVKVGFKRQDKITLWAIVGVNVEPDDRYFSVFATGEDLAFPMPTDDKTFGVEHVASALDAENNAWHVFEIAPQPIAKKDSMQELKDRAAAKAEAERVRLLNEDTNRDEKTGEEVAH